MTELAPEIISLPDLTATVARYDEAIEKTPLPNKPDPLAAVDAWRRTELPKAIAARSPPHMTKAELYRLVECKLKRGKMRPILHLIAANNEDTVVDTTTAAFATADIKAAFEQLCSGLRGVGPATASYVLAAHRPTQVPVFSDEGFRWIVYYGGLIGPGSAVPSPWGCKIKYSQAEYWDYYEKASAVVSRLQLESCEDVERAGFVLGQEAARLNVVDTKIGRKRKSGANNGGESEGEAKGKGKVKGKGKSEGRVRGKSKSKGKGEGRARAKGKDTSKEEVKAGGGGEGGDGGGEEGGEPQKDGRRKRRKPLPGKKEPPPRTASNTATS